MVLVLLAGRLHHYLQINSSCSTIEMYLNHSRCRPAMT